MRIRVVSNLGRPGGNITGIGVAGGGLAAKRLQLLKEAVPTVSRVAVIQDQGIPGQALSEMQAAAPALQVEVVPIYIRTADDLDGALDAAVKARADALVQTAGFVTGTQTSARKISEFAIQHRWPTVNVAADLGGLLNYNAVLIDPWRRAATFVDRILRGENPGEIPVEGPTGSTFVINMCTAARLGLTIPQSVLTLTTSLVQCPSP